MNTKRSLYSGLLIAALVAVACSPPATPEPRATLFPTATIQRSTISGDEVSMGFTEEGSPYRGNPGAPVTLLEYSDFQ